MNISVYVVWYDNGEEWEDHFETVDGIFTSREKAIKSLEKKGYVRHETKWGREEWRLEPPKCRAGVSDYDACRGCECPLFKDCGNGECDDVMKLCDDSRSYCYIKEEPLDHEE